MIDSPVLIAIIDDDPSVCRALQRLVRSFGMRASTFPSGETFFHVLALGENPSCVVVDIQMPGMNGFQVQQRMLQEHLDIPVIFITAHMDKDFAERAAAAGVIGFLDKPFTDHALMMLIQRALCRTGGNDTRSNGKVE
jgi:FixJ family two-component response regulator